MDEKKCWELKSNCMMRNQSREDAACPAYRQGLGCWEVDWNQIIGPLPASQQEYWLSFLAKCPGCVAYEAHPLEMQAVIDRAKELFLND